MNDDDYDDEEWADRVEMFADPGGDSALRAATKSNPRDQKCPTCGWPNRLTRADVSLGYQCDSCANAQERGMDINYYEGNDQSGALVLTIPRDDFAHLMAMIADIESDEGSPTSENDVRELSRIASDLSQQADGQDEDGFQPLPGQD